MLTTFPSFSAFAQETSSKEQLTEKGELWQPESNSNALNFEGDLSLEELKSAELADEDTPEIVSSDAIEENGHVNRLWEQEEDLNSIVFQNRDGTKTMYYYAEPIKYKDKAGNVKDKKNKLTDTGNDYTNVENDINTYFPKKVHKNKGVILKYDNVRIEVAPLINGSSGASRQTGHNKDGQNTDYVEYLNVFDEKISLRYTPTFNGYKEDIILQENVGLNEFQFKLTTDGLQLVEEYGLLYLSNPLTGKKIVSIGDIVVYDSAPFIKEDIPTHKPKLNEVTSSEVESIETYTHSYHIQTVVEDQEYILTMVVDKDYLSDSERVYPVYIDPTVKIEQNNRIQDATIYSNYNVNDGNNAYLYVGYQGSKGIARSLVRFPGLMNHSTLKNISVNQIQSVKYIPIELHRGSGLWVDAYAATQYWTQSGVKCNSTIWNAYGNFIDDAYMSPYQGTDSDGNNVGTGNWYPFDITSIYKSWRSGAYGGVSNHYGIMLKAYQEGLSTVAQLGSAQHSSLFPSVMVKYNTYISVSQVCMLPSYVTLDPNDTFYMSACVLPSNATNKSLVWKSSNNSIATVSNSGMICASSPGTVTITAESAEDNTKYATAIVKVNRIFNISWTDSIFITQLTNPECAFNQPGSNYSFDFERAYNLLQLFKKTYDEGNYVRAIILENLGYCAPGAGIAAEGLLNSIYNNSLLGKSYYDEMMELNIQWQQHLMIGLSFFYYDLIFNQINRVNINNSTFNPNSPLDMLEKDGVTFNAKDGKLTAWKGYRTGNLSDLPSDAQIMYNKYSDSGWKGNVSGQTPGTKAGATFDNIPRAGEAKLPTSKNGVSITYKEFDVNNYIDGLGRDSVRFVRGSDGSVYYTQDHYKTYIKIQ